MKSNPASDSRTDDLALLRQISCGDADAFSLLYNRYKDALYQYALCMLKGREEDAREAVQNLFLKFFRNLEAFTNSREFKPYFFRSLKNECAAIQNRKVFLDDAKEAMPERCVSGNEGNREIEFKDWLQSLCADLPPEQREVIALKVSADFSFREISEMQGVAEPTIASRWWHGLRKLRERLKP